MPHEFKITVSPRKTKERLDVFLTHHIENATRSKVQHAIEQGLVSVDGKAVKSGYKISPGQVIHIIFPQPPPPDILPENIPLEILYEDDYLLVINKPSGMVTHPAYSHYSGTLVNALLYHCKDYLSSTGDPARPGIVHRLDKDTSGLIVVAKTDLTHSKLAKQFSLRTIEREYWAVVWGLFRGKQKNRGIIGGALGRSKSDRKKVAVVEVGKRAVTAYEVLQEFKYLSLVRLTLLTGRTHQIRVHLHHIGHPVFGDPTYGGRRIAWGGAEKKKKEEIQHLLNIIPRQALHAKTLGFIHPATNKKLSFDSELPEDMKKILNFLRSQTGST